MQIDFPPDLEFGASAQKNFLESIPYLLGKACDIEISDSCIIVSDPPDDVKGLESAVLDAVKRSSETVARAVERVLDENHLETPIIDDVTEILSNRGDIRQTGNGKYVYSGQVAQVFRCLDNMFREWAEKQSAHEEFFPISVRAESLAKAGYFNTFAQHAFFVSPLELSMNAILSAQDDSIFDPDADPQTRQNLQAPEWVLSPTVCHHCFESRSGQSATNQQTITALNQCSRYEVHDTSGLQRLRHYWMREIIYFRPDAKFVQAALEDILEVTTQRLRRWGLSFKVVSASDPFFLDSGSSKRLFQTALLLKRELQMPVSGKYIACASFNNHQQSLTNTFEISSDQGEIASGCVGWGYDRLILAMFSQLGPDIHLWPEVVRSDLKLLDRSI